MIRRREALVLLTNTAAIAFQPHAAMAAAADVPSDFGLVAEETSAPSRNYMANAEKLLSHLEWSVENLDEAAGMKMKEEIQAFSALYRKDKYTSYGLMPGFLSLQTAYDALSAHNARYGPGKVALPDQLAGTILRNTNEAKQQIATAKRKAKAAAAAAAAAAAE